MDDAFLITSDLIWIFARIVRVYNSYLHITLMGIRITFLFTPEFQAPRITFPKLPAITQSF